MCSSSKGILIYILMALSVIQLCNCKCTVNPEYSMFVQGSGYLEMKLSENQPEKINDGCVVRNEKMYDGCVLQNEVRYKGCILRNTKNNQTQSFIFGKMTRYKWIKNTGESRICFMNGNETPNCTVRDNYLINITESLRLKPFEFYFVQCGNSGGSKLSNVFEVVVEEETMPQMSVNFFKDQSDKTFLVYPSQQIHCNPMCIEDNIDITTSNPSLVKCNSNICTVSTHKMDSKKVTLTCSDDLKAFVRPVFNIKAKIQSTHDDRYDFEFDAGDVLYCKFDILQKIESNEVLFKSLLVRLAISFGTSFLPGSHTVEVKIPHKTSKDLHAKCYIGNISSTHYVLVTSSLTIRSRWLTYIANRFGPVPVFDFRTTIQKVQNDIWCDNNQYDDLRYVFEFHARENYFPRSNIHKYYGVNLFMKPVKKHKINTNPDYRKNRYVSCATSRHGYDSISTPIMMKANDIPKISWKYINPPFETKYHLRGFLIICKGEAVDEIKTVCKDCRISTRIQFDVFRRLVATIFIGEDNMVNHVVKVQCIAKSRGYTNIFMTKYLTIIARHFRGINIPKPFLLLGVDKILCVAKFNNSVDDADKQTKASRSSIVTQPLVTLAQINGKEEISYDHFGIRTDIYTNVRIIRFQYCCPSYRYDAKIGLRNFYCPTYKTVDVVRNFYIHYSIPLNNIFPGVKVSCHLCVNYTHEDDKLCHGKNKIPSKIRFTYENLIGKMSDSGETTTAQIPSINTLKRVQDYKYKIGCRTNRPIVLQEFTLRSCERNPPPVYIIPFAKTLFKIGENLSCVTKSTLCKNKLKYTVYVQRKNQIENTVSTSFQLQRRHAGNEITVKCAPGEALIETDVRLIRVEVAPYNLTIAPVNRYVWYDHFFHCYSLGFPKPTYRWTQLMGTSKLRISEGYVLVGPWDFSGLYQIKCEATNKQGVMSANITFNIFNRRILNSNRSHHFYTLICLFIFFYLIFMFGSTVIIYQENYFNVPFFSNLIVKTSDLVVEMRKDESKMTTSATTEAIG